MFDVIQKRTAHAVYVQYEILIVALVVTVVWDLRHESLQLPADKELLPLPTPVIQAHYSGDGGTKLLRNISSEHQSIRHHIIGDGESSEVVMLSKDLSADGNP